MVEVSLVPRMHVRAVWPWMAADAEVYRRKSPHVTPVDILEFLEDPQGDELLVVSVDRKYAGFLTFRVGEADGEIWGTLGMIVLTPEAQAEGDVLEEMKKQVEEILKVRGCNVMNYLTRRKGFKRLAPRLGFEPGLIEWRRRI